MLFPKSDAPPTPRVAAVGEGLWEARGLLSHSGAVRWQRKRGSAAKGTGARTVLTGAKHPLGYRR